MEIFKSRKKVILLLLGLILILLILNLIKFNARPEGQPDQTIPQELKIMEITPPDNIILLPGSSQTFSIQFSTPIKTAFFDVLVNRTDLISENVISEQINTSLTNNDTKLEIKLQNPIEGYSSYELAILSSSNKQKLFEARYLSDKPSATPAPSNNVELKQFLPFKTETYEIEFNPQSNIYVFHFIYNPESLEDLDTQYQNAKQAATEFIQSKGININTITIEWRYS